MLVTLDDGHSLVRLGLCCPQFIDLVVVVCLSLVVRHATMFLNLFSHTALGLVMARR